MFVCDYQARGIYMAYVDGDSSFKDADFTLLPLDNVETPIAIQYDLRSRTIYWTDVALDAIYRSNIDGSGNEKIISDLECKSNVLIVLSFNVEQVTWCSGPDQNWVQICFRVSVNLMSVYLSNKTKPLWSNTRL